MEHTGNVKKADRLRYWLTFLFKDLDVGQTFKPDALHLTIIPWFVTEMPDTEVIKSFQLYFAGQKSFEINIGKQDEFKNKRKIPINFVEPAADTRALHKRALDWFSELDGRWAVKNPHVGDEFVPHVRRRPGHNFSESDKVRITSLSLVTANRRGDDLRTVIAKVDFDEK